MMMTPRSRCFRSLTPWGSRVSRTCLPSQRMHATSTMDLVTSSSQSSDNSIIYSTLDGTPAVPPPSYSYGEFHAALPDPATICLRSAERLPIQDALAKRHLYDKLLLVVVPGQADDGRLTGRGIGQALSLSRQTARYCTPDALVPELFVAGASRTILQTLFLSFPYDTPYHSVHGVTWMACNSMVGAGVKLEQEFHGVHATEDEPQSPAELLEWLQFRPERTVVGMY